MSNENITEIIGKVTDFLKSELKTETVVGQPFQLGEFSCVPVVRIGTGFGYGGGAAESPKDGHGEGSGAGVGLGVDTIGFLVTRADQISFISTQKTSALSSLFEKAPDLIEKMMGEKKQAAAA